METVPLRHARPSFLWTRRTCQVSPRTAIAHSSRKKHLKSRTWLLPVYTRSDVFTRYLFAGTSRRVPERRRKKKERENTVPKPNANMVPKQIGRWNNAWYTQYASRGASQYRSRRQEQSHVFPSPLTQPGTLPHPSPPPFFYPQPHSLLCVNENTRRKNQKPGLNVNRDELAGRNQCLQVSPTGKFENLPFLFFTLFLPPPLPSRVFLGEYKNILRGTFERRRAQL